MTIALSPVPSTYPSSSPPGLSITDRQVETTSLTFCPSTFVFSPCNDVSTFRNSRCGPCRRSTSQFQHATRRRARSGPTMSWKPAGLLRDAVDLKKIEVEMVEGVLRDRPDHPINMKRSFYAHQPIHDFSRSLRRRDGTLAVVPAIKRFLAPARSYRLDDSPKPTDPDFDSYNESSDRRAELVCQFPEIEADVRGLWAIGADAALFYTDALRHGVELNELRQTSRALASVGTPLPLVRHDIIIDAVQIAEAVEAGAKAVNIVAAAALPEVPELLDAATMMGMEAIVECHTKLEVDFAMEAGATMIFLNNWDRTRNVLVPRSATSLIENVPPYVLTLAGGGLTTASDCWDMLDAGFNGVVLGTSLLRSNRPKAFIEEIRAVQRCTGDVFSGDMGVPFSQDSLLRDSETAT